MKGSVEDGHLGNLGQKLTGRLDSGQVGRIVQRRQLDIGFDGGDDRFVDLDGITETLPAMHDTMADSLNLVGSRHDAFFRVHQACSDLLHGYGMVGKDRFQPDFTLGGGLLQETSALANALDQALAKTLPPGHQKNLILE